MTQRRVVVVGSLPPPVAGAALVNQMVLDALRSRGVATTALDVSVAGLAHHRSLPYHARRVATNLRVALNAYRARGPRATLYIVPDAGAGAWYTAVILRAASEGFDRTVIHHHSCRYIGEHSRPVAMFTDLTRQRATHVFLTVGMAAAFQERYGSVRSHVATNARFVAEEAARPLSPRPAGPLRLGQLSNLCADKGFFTTVDTFEAVRDAGIAATLSLAGPILEAGVEQRMRALTMRHGADVRYLGPVSGDAKRRFYDDIDVFLFPTEWRQEAAPLVIYEALAAGVPVLATDRGVIRELIAGPAGAVCPKSADFTAFAIDWLRSFDDGGRADAVAIKAQIRRSCDESAVQYERLMAMLADEADDGGTGR